MKGVIHKTVGDSSRIAEAFCRDNADTMIDIVNLLVGTFNKGRKVLLFGNGGSAADAQHLAAEFVNRFRLDRRALPAVALTTDTSILTSVANDSSFDKIFSRQVEALGKVDDVAFGLSTSGNSENVLAGIIAARKIGMITVGFSGGDGGDIAAQSDYCLVVPSTDTPRIQECHILAGHIICELVEKETARERA